MKRFATLIAIAALLAAPLAFAGNTNNTTGNKTADSGHMTGRHGTMMHQSGMMGQGHMNGQQGMMNRSDSGQMTPAQMMQKMSSDSRDLDQQFIKMDKQYQAMMKINDMTKLKAQMQQFDQMMNNMRQHMMQHQQMQERMQSMWSQYSQTDQPKKDTKN